MRHYVLFDTKEIHLNLLPLSFTRPIAQFRVGIDTIADKWNALLGAECTFRPVEYLRMKFEQLPADDADTIYIAGNIIPTSELAEKVAGLKKGETLYDEKGIVAVRGITPSEETVCPEGELELLETRRINYVFDIFLRNAEVLREDFRRITAGRKSRPLSVSNRVIGPYLDEEGNPLIFLEEGASAEGAVFNTTEGPVYIGEDAQVMECAAVRGPVAFNRKVKIKMGAKIYGGTTFGPYCKIGGEVDNTVVFGYSNKAHDGYLGNAVVGEWCNIGAGVNASNLKNDYSFIRIWNYATRSFMRTKLQFCGLIMGDHSKAGINCMFNTATVVGVGCNIYGSGFPRVFIPSFSEGSPASGFSDVSLKKFYDIAERVLSRRELMLDDEDRRIYERVYAVAESLKH
ncbi:MAG: glucose-1-phosphate thymidylyltransferase [Muribaculaceae bacterium]|nr:glucose-1-phosphate thymidylyltransferase [Muribaculaceae bacterium]